MLNAAPTHACRSGDVEAPYKEIREPESKYQLHSSNIEMFCVKRSPILG
jgi:hypothetical protein